MEALSLKDSFYLLCDEPKRLESLGALFDDLKGKYQFVMEDASENISQDVLQVGT